jgi:hypothetical protein
MRNSFKAYEELINPLWIRGLIKTEERFIDWCNESSIGDLYNALIVFEREGMFEDCEIVRNAIQQKENLITINQIIQNSN